MLLMLKMIKKIPNNQLESKMLTRDLYLYVA